MELGKAAIKGVKWTVDFYPDGKDVVTVYSEGGGSPDLSDVKWRYPEYMVYIRHTDWDKAKELAYKVYDLFHSKLNFTVTEAGQDIYVLSLFALSEPIRIGVNSDDDRMEYSVNFRATLREE